MERRRFTLLDAMVLVAATAIGLALAKTYLSVLGNLGMPADMMMRFRIAVTYPLLEAWAVALLVLRMRQPRPGYRRLARKPGTAACYTTVFGMAFSVTLFLIRAMKSTWVASPPAGFHFVNLFTAAAYPIAPSVAAVWVALALGGRRRAGKDWIEWLGLLVGVGWIALFLVLTLTM